MPLFYFLLIGYRCHICAATSIIGLPVHSLFMGITPQLILLKHIIHMFLSLLFLLDRVIQRTFFFISVTIFSEFLRIFLSIGDMSNNSSGPDFFPIEVWSSLINLWESGFHFLNFYFNPSIINIECYISFKSTRYWFNNSTHYSLLITETK